MIGHRNIKEPNLWEMREPLIRPDLSHRWGAARSSDCTPGGPPIVNERYRAGAPPLTWVRPQEFPDDETGNDQ